MEVGPLKLSAEHFPLPLSVLKPVLARYAEEARSAPDDQAMLPEELIQYIRNSDSYDLPPLEAILAQTESIGDPALPNKAQVAVLRWLGSAMQEWEINYPIEEPLADQIGQLKVLAAGLAITDKGFLTPGVHPIHKILDTIQSSAIGWQPRLGRAGQALERQVARVVESALKWFEDRETDLEAICSVLVTASERDLERTQRMVQRVVETEQGKVKTIRAKQQAAGMINAALEQYPVPQGIGEFLTGHWYASAQLVLLKFGEESEQWQHMSATTNKLLDSLQSTEEQTDERRQYIFDAVTQIPKDLKRWLLNLHHDQEAVNDAVGLIEFAHLRILRQQSLVLEKIEPIPLNPDDVIQIDAEDYAALDTIDSGQWFSLPSPDGPLRAQLALKMEEAKQLLFTNQAGLKVLQQGYGEFAALMAQNLVIPLHAGASFSACLASAAGISTVEELDEFTGAAIERARLAAEEQQRQEAERLEQERLEQERLEQERLEQERLEQERLEQQRLEQERLEQERREQERKAQEASRDKEKIDEYLRKKQERSERQGTAPAVPAATKDVKTPDKDEPPAQSFSEEVVLNLPMGAWLGFHDGNTPLLAKLAVHDREQDQYFFVNREGIKMRQLSKKELLDLMDQGLVDVLETNSNFREEVTRIRGESDQ